MHILLKTQCGAKHTRGNKTTRKKSDSLEIQAIERKRRKEKKIFGRNENFYNWTTFNFRTRIAACSQWVTGTPWLVMESPFQGCSIWEMSKYVHPVLINFQMEKVGFWFMNLYPLFNDKVQWEWAVFFILDQKKYPLYWYKPISHFFGW